MKKQSSLLLCTLLLCAVLAACAGGGKEPNYTALPAITPSPVASDEVWPPEEDMTVLRAEPQLLQADAFELALRLPEGWSTELTHQAEAGLLPDGLEALALLKDGQGQTVGAIGFMPNPVLEEASDDPMALFAGITLAKHRFDGKEAYRQLVNENGRLVAVTDAVHEFSAGDGGEDYANLGILLRDENGAGVCVGIEISAGALTDAELTALAESLFVRACG